MSSVRHFAGFASYVWLVSRRAAFVLAFVLVAAVAATPACVGPAVAPRVAASGDLVVRTTSGSPRQAGADVVQADPAAEDDVPVPISSDDPVRGSRLAYVTIVVFSDFQCPFCARLAATLDRVRDAYGDAVRIVFKEQPLPFHAHAELAAEVGHGVYALKGPDAFWRFHDAAFRRQPQIAPDTIRAWAIAAGADSRLLEEGLAHKTWAAKIRRDEAIAKKLGAVGTPSSFVDGILVSGAQPFEMFEDVIDAELVKAKELAQQGVARDVIYARRVAANFLVQKDARHDDEDEDDDHVDATVWKVPIAGSPVRGPNTAPVTIILFSDFQCPFCKRIVPMLAKIRADYGDRVRIVWKDEPLPFHPRALPAALLARSARAQKGDAGFWSVHDKLFDSQPKLDDTALEAVARAAGLDVGKAMAAVRNKSFAKEIDTDVALADDVRASGTPHFFVNGRRLVGAQGFDKFKPLIDAELAKAEALVRAGVASAAVYDTIMKDANEAPGPERRVVAASVLPAPFRGTPNAKVVIQQFSDFQCPFCARVEPTIDELVKAYPGKISVVWRNLPLAMHRDAELAAEAALEAFAQKGNEGFSKMRELLFKHQEDEAGLKRTSLEGYAVKIGLDAKKFGKALDDGVHRASIDRDRKAASDAEINGTPSFLIGPYFVSGVLPLAKFKRLVDRVLAEPVQASPAPPALATPSTSLPRTSAAGLVVIDLAVGTGPAVKAGDTVSVHYVGTRTDGTTFDSSRQRNRPLSIELGKGRVIKGWEAGLVGMKVGGRRKLTIPPDLAYGGHGFPPKIPPNVTLVFDIELLAIT